MALLTNSIFIANSNYRFDVDWEEYSWWNTDIFETTIWGSSIKNTMLWYITKDITDKWLIIWYVENRWDFQEYFEIYFYSERLRTQEDYKEYWKKVWFWFINIRSLKV